MKRKEKLNKYVPPVIEEHKIVIDNYFVAGSNNGGSDAKKESPTGFDTFDDFEQ